MSICSVRGLSLSVLVPACVLIGALPAAGSIAGDTYMIRGENFPDTYGPSPVVFDGIEESVPGSAKMLVNEYSAPLSVTSELLEFSFRTNDGSQLAGNPLALVNLSIMDLDFNRPGMTQVARKDTAFLYFTTNGQPLPMTDVLGAGLVFLPHPLNPAIQVVLLGNSAIQGTADGLDLGDPFPDSINGQPLTWFVTMMALGLGGQVNDVHMGVVIDHVPEPATLMLVAGGLAALIRRRR